MRDGKDVRRMVDGINEMKAGDVCCIAKKKKEAIESPRIRGEEKLSQTMKSDVRATQSMESDRVRGERLLFCSRNQLLA